MPVPLSLRARFAMLPGCTSRPAAWAAPWPRTWLARARFMLPQLFRGFDSDGAGGSPPPPPAAGAALECLEPLATGFNLEARHRRALQQGQQEDARLRLQLPHSYSLPSPQAAEKLRQQKAAATPANVDVAAV